MLFQLLKEARKYRVPYKGNFSNHLPMALTAAHKMGASDTNLVNIFEAEAKNLELYENYSYSISIENWKSYLGKREAEKSLCDFFLKYLNKEGREKSAHLFLPTLMEGMPGGAFHPMIQAWYATHHSLENEELAASFAGWCSFYDAIPNIPQGANKNISQMLEVLRNSASMKKIDSTEDFIAERVSNILNNEEFKDIVKDTHTSLQELEKLRLTFAQLYPKAPGIAFLHGITSAQAFTGLLQFLDANQQEKAIKEYMISALALFVSIGMPEEIAEPPKNIASWEEIFAAALQVTDPHVIKLTYTSYLEYNRSQDAIYHQIAHKTVFP